jgi:hypothetical protein
MLNKLDAVKMERDFVYAEIKAVAQNTLCNETISQPIDLEMYGSMRTGTH